MEFNASLGEIIFSFVPVGDYRDQFSKHEFSHNVSSMLSTISVITTL